MGNGADSDLGGRVHVDLGALGRNFSRIKEAIAGREIYAVVKADAYGHGAVEVARTLAREGQKSFAVALLSEALELRHADIEGDILILGPVAAAALPQLSSARLVASLSSWEQLQSWLRSPPDTPVDVHVKVDTGLCRLGLDASELRATLERVRQTPWLRLRGLFSHLSESESLDPSFTRRQERAFEEARLELTDDERLQVHCHLGNSAALYHTSCHYDAVRVGGALYGIDLTQSALKPRPGRLPLEGVMRVVAPVVQVRELQTGTAVGYGRLWSAARKSRIAVVPVGYADGFATGFRGADALIRGLRAPVVGAVSMDRLTLDITETGGEVGEEVVLLGEQGDEQITALDLARQSGEAAYEVTCRFALRLPRVFVR